MSRPVRLALFAISGCGLAAIMLVGFHRLPDFGHAHELYGALSNRIEPTLRHATDIVTALNFDIRAFDTLGEEFILFASVSGVALLLRQMRDEDEEEQTSAGVEEHGFAGASDGLKLTSLVLIPLLVAFGAYLVFHGQLTPGGGFQGGVVLAAGPLAVFLAGRYLRMNVIAPHWLAESGEALGALGYALIGLGGLVFADVFFKNFLPLGLPGHILSAGQIPLASVAVGIEVAGAFLVAWTEFLDEALIVKGGGQS
jgi:multicomponent Na+:H+ antiporter subunit B